MAVFIDQLHQARRTLRRPSQRKMTIEAETRLAGKILCIKRRDVTVRGVSGDDGHAGAVSWRRGEIDGEYFSIASRMRRFVKNSSWTCRSRMSAVLVGAEHALNGRTRERWASCDHLFYGHCLIETQSSRQAIVKKWWSGTYQARGHATCVVASEHEHRYVRVERDRHEHDHD